MANVTPGILRITCQHMRHKLMYISSDYGVPGMVEMDSETRVYWCTKTQEVLGPDNLPVGPGDCSNGRSCYCGRAAAPITPGSESTGHEQRNIA